MKNFNLSTPLSMILMTLGLAFFCTATVAEGMSKDQYKIDTTKIDAQYKYGKARCESLAGNTKDICEAEEKGKRDIAKAELELAYTPTIKTRYEVHVAKANASYSVAMQKCDEKAGNAEDICEKEAKAAKVHEMADAPAPFTTIRTS